MANNCQWCGKPLEKKVIASGDKIREVCARCGYKIREYKRPEPVKVEEKPAVIELRDEEKPVIKQKPIWPWVIAGLVLILLIIIIVKLFLVK
jgi:uncharacterized membrane protein YvbJ